MKSAKPAGTRFDEEKKIDAATGKWPAARRKMDSYEPPKSFDYHNLLLNEADQQRLLPP